MKFHPDWTGSRQCENAHGWIIQTGKKYIRIEAVHHEESCLMFMAGFAKVRSILTNPLVVDTFRESEFEALSLVISSWIMSGKSPAMFRMRHLLKAVEARIKRLPNVRRMNIR